MTGGAHLMQQ